ncbi:MAG: helix-turn-helix domain-containing protein [Peptococcaceae bacterium]|jgi:transcriptional regulator with XRE-family HTH domain|nr:helix-turn-helix domain-containing protein [Peptococcaceae bacterium]
MAGEGELLKRARENKGWSLEQVEKTTRIRVRYLKALEEEDYAILPGSAYVKGFLRTYAKHLGIHLDDIMDLTKRSLEETVKPLPAPKPLKPIRTKPFWLRPAVSAGMACLALLLVIGIAHFSQSRDKIADNDLPGTLVPGVTESNEEAQSNPQIPGQGEEDSANHVSSLNTTIATNEEFMIQIICNEDCWLHVEADGQQVIYGSLLAGTIKEFQAKNLVTFVTIGNAGGISVTLNGVMQAGFGRPGQVVNNIVFTKDMLNR